MKLMARLTRSWASQTSRTDKRVINNLGKIRSKMAAGSSKMYRSIGLEVLDAYFENRQYDHLLPWENSIGADGVYIPLHERKPKIVMPLTRLLCQRLTSRLVGDDVFPTMNVEQDPETKEYLRMIINAAQIKSRVIQPMQRLLNNGSTFMRFYIEDGNFILEHYDSKYCYPKLNAAGQLQSIEIKYVYDDENDKDQKGTPKKKWYKLELGQMSDVLYDNPPFDADKDPVFQVVATAEHEMGFVQGEWFRTAESKNSPDGYPLTEGILDFVDALNYSISQSENAVQYNQDPQLYFKNVDEEAMDNLIRSASKSWALGRDGEAGFLESNLNGVQIAMELRDKMRGHVMDFARIVLMDPEKMAGHAQSGRALEILHGPMVELIKELRPMIGQGLKMLVTKMAIANLIQQQRGQPSPVIAPAGWVPQSLEITLSWPPVFPMTIEDLQKKIQVASQAASSFLISEETATAWVAKDFGVEDIEQERAKIAGQPIRNPFGGF